MSGTDRPATGARRARAVGHGRSAVRHRTNKPLLSVEETAVLLGQSRSSLYRSIEKGDLPLPAFRISGRWRIPRRAVERLLDGYPPCPKEDGPDVASRYVLSLIHI